MFEIFVTSAACLPLYAAFIVCELVMRYVDKLRRNAKEKAPRTLACSREQGTKSNKSIALK